MRFSTSQLLFVIHLIEIASLLWKIRFDLIMISTTQRSFRWSFLNNPSTLHKCVHCAVFNISWCSCIVLVHLSSSFFSHLLLFASQRWKLSQFPAQFIDSPGAASIKFVITSRKRLPGLSGHLTTQDLGGAKLWKWRRLVPLQLTDK